MGGLLILGAAVVFATNYQSVREIYLFGDVLLVRACRSSPQPHWR